MNIATVSSEAAKGAQIPPDVAPALRLDHLRALEAESIHILRGRGGIRAAGHALFDRQGLVCDAAPGAEGVPSGADSLPLLHVDTTYKFREMIQFRDEMARTVGARLIVHTNTDAIADGAQPFKLGTQRCCGLLKTKALLDALEAGTFDAALGGARRDEERSRAKERIFSVRDAKGQWDRSGSGRSCGTC